MATSAEVAVWVCHAAHPPSAGRAKWWVLVAAALLGCGGRASPPVDGGADGDADSDAGSELPCPDVCEGADRDADGVPAAPCGSDCDDDDALVHAGAVDPAGDGVDSDCDGADGVDLDGDGHLDARAAGDDCDDGDATIHPGANDNQGWVFEEMGYPVVGVLVELQLDRFGRPHLAILGTPCWTDQPDGETYRDGFTPLSYATKRSGAWSRTEVDGESCIWPRVGFALDDRGRAHIAYGLATTSSPEDGLRLATVSPAGTEVSTLLDEWVFNGGVALSGDRCGEAMEVADVARLEATDSSSSALWAGRFTAQDGDWAGEWATIQVGATPQGQLTALQLSGTPAPDGSLALAYRTGQELRFARRSGGSWQIETVTTVEVPEHPCDTALAFDRSGEPRVVQTGTGLLYGHRDGDHWEVESVDVRTSACDDNWAQGSATLVIDREGAAHTVNVVTPPPPGSSYQKEIHYFTNRSGVWEDELLGIGQGPSLALDRHDGIHLAYAEPGTIVYGTIREGTDGVDQNCDGVDGVDADHDGHASAATGGDDTDDAVPSR